MAVTQKMLAEYLNITQPAVSAALRSIEREGEGGTSQVGGETRRRVLDAARELGYFRNRSASSLRSRRSWMIGIVHFYRPQSQYLMEKVERIARAVEEAGYSPVYLDPQWFRSSPERFAENLLGAHLDGIFLFNVTNELDLDQVLKQEIPVVSVQSPISYLGRVCCVNVNKKEAFCELFMHLYRNGRRKIYAGVESHTSVTESGNIGRTAMELRDGFIEGHRRLGLSYDEKHFIIADGGRESSRDVYLPGVNIMREMNKVCVELPDAMLLQNDSTAIGALSWCRENGVSVPEQLAITGFNNEDQSMYAAVPLTTVRQDVDTMVEKAMQEMLALLEKGKPPRKSKVIEIPCHVVIRESSGGKR